MLSRKASEAILQEIFRTSGRRKEGLGIQCTYSFPSTTDAVFRAETKLEGHVRQGGQG